MKEVKVKLKPVTITAILAVVLISVYLSQDFIIRHLIFWFILVLVLRYVAGYWMVAHFARRWSKS